MVRLNETVGQPWRYECPHCSAYDVVRIYSATKIRGKQYPYGAKGKTEAAHDRDIDWRCKQCCERLERVYDTKVGEIADIAMVYSDTIK